MWWIIPFVLVVILLLALIIGFAIWLIKEHEKGDYGDGGGQFFGGNNDVPFFSSRQERAGVWGEEIANFHLRPLLRNDEYLLANLLFPLKNGHSSEVDCVMISRKGIFCIEVKKWVGHISGADNDEYWLQEYDDPSLDDRKHFNPVMQNQNHCRIIERALHKEYKVNNIVVFVRLEDGDGIESNNAFTIQEFKDYYRKLDSIALDENDLLFAFENLKKYIGSEEEIKNHKSKEYNRP